MQHLPEGTEENHKEISTVGHWGLDLNQRPSEYEAGVLGINWYNRVSCFYGMILDS
jgi:hypothetical protein